MKTINREELINEMILRENIQKIIKSVKLKDHIQENKLRKYVRKIILEKSAIDDEVPHHSTGINILEELLKKIIPALEDGYKTLTSDEEQRRSFRAHIVHAVQNTLAPHKAEDMIDSEDAEKMIAIDEENDSFPDVEMVSDLDEEEDIAVTIGDSDEENDTKDGEFIDVDSISKTEKEKEEEEKIQQFSLEDQDITGRNVALQTFDKVDNQIIDAYAVLESEEDRSVFYEFLITNLKLYMDKWETTLQTALGEPSTTSYEAEKEREKEEI